MGYNARVLADSLSPDGVRLTTLEVTFPRIVLAEFNTHRVFSRNSASSRAIPVEKMLKRVQEDPFVPVYWGKNQKGMQADEELPASEQAAAEETWLAARDHAVYRANQLLALGIHKQITNRLLEPWLWHTVIVTATEWDNWDGLRRNKDAQPEIREVATLMWDALGASTPTQSRVGSWHRPLVSLDEFLAHPGGKRSHDSEGYRKCCEYWNRVSVGRCARVSYLTHDGKRDPEADIQLYERLLASGHMSPFEHVARPATFNDVEAQLRAFSGVAGVDGLDLDVRQHFFGNFRGWVQLRKLLPCESNFKARSSIEL